MRTHFVLPAVSQDLCDKLAAEGVDAHWDEFINGPHSWCLTAYILLRQRGRPVTCGPQFQSGCINVAHVSSIEPFSFARNHFIVAVRADYTPRPLANLHLVQNKSQAGANSYWLPHWPQPGLIPRSPDRVGVKVVAYAGQNYYLAGGTSEWQRELSKHGLEFRMMPPDRWNDFSGVDVLVAIRSFDGYAYNRKPPTKLINAWHARVPLVAGNDSAYRQLGTPGKNYLVCNTLTEAVSRIVQLAREPAEYAYLVANGSDLAREYSRDKIAETWEGFLDSVAGPRYQEWVRKGCRSRSKYLGLNLVSLARAMARDARHRLVGPIPFQR